MLHHIKGKLIEKNPTYLIVETNGIGYYINISLNTYSQLSNDESIKLLLHQTIKEDAHILHGFADASERLMFQYLISVNGVGVSTAQMMLSSMPPDEISAHIINDNANALKAIKGIRAKTALRIIIDLKDKIQKVDVNQDFSFVQHNTQHQEALSALLALGFDKSKCQKVLDKLVKEDTEQSVEDLITAALKML